MKIHEKSTRIARDGVHFTVMGVSIGNYIFRAA